MTKTTISTGEELEPELVYRGQTLRPGIDYIWQKEGFWNEETHTIETPDFVEPGEYRVALFGKGLYTGRKYDKIFNIVRSEEAAQALIAEARSNLKDAQDAFANLDPDDPTAMQQLFADLFAAQNALTEAQIKGKTATVKYDTLKKKSQTLAVTQVIKFTKQIKDKKTYILSSVKKGEKSFKTYFKINKTTGKLTVKKGLKKGTCKVAVKVKAAGNSNYKASGYKTVTSTVKVK